VAADNGNDVAIMARRARCVSLALSAGAGDYSRRSAIALYGVNNGVA